MLEIQDWGHIEYYAAWDRQKELAEDIKLKRDRSVFVVCSHPSVITIGKSGTEDNILMNPAALEKYGVQVATIDRGGDVTLHNPGQLVGYFIFNLEDYKTDLHWFLREIEESIIELVARFGIKAHRMEGLTGAWVENKRKICAIGMHCSRWVTTHGFALNVNNNLSEFTYIVPCGIKNKEITSIEKESGTAIAFDSVKEQCIEIIKNKF